MKDGNSFLLAFIGIFLMATSFFAVAAKDANWGLVLAISASGLFIGAGLFRCLKTRK